MKINQDKERAELKANVIEHVNIKFAAYSTEVKTELRSIFNQITLKDWAETVKFINEFDAEITIEVYRTFVMPYSPLYISKEESDSIRKETMLPMRDGLNAKLKKELADLKLEISNEYQAKKNELEAIEKASASEKKRLEAEAKKREAEKAAEIARKQKEDEEAARAASQQQKTEANMANLFDNAESVDKPKRTGYFILLTHPMGWLPIMNLWFEQQGKNMSIDDAAKVTLDRMKRFCESHAHKTEEFIKSPYLKYEEEYKQKAVTA